MIGIVVYLFLIHLSLGILISLCFLSPAELGRGFFRFTGLLASGMLGLGVVLVLTLLFPEGTASPYIPTGSAAAGAFAASLGATLVHAITLQKMPGWLSRLLLGLAIALGLAGLVSPAKPAQDVLPLLTVMASVLLLGSVITDMILGHWYLVIPKLPAGHLQRMTLIFLGALAARTAFLIWSSSAWLDPRGIEDVTLFFIDRGVFFVVRILLGILLPWVLGYMTWHTARMRSTQSATGILYVVAVFTLFGELLAKFFWVADRLPL